MDEKRDEKEFTGDLAIDEEDAEQVTGGVTEEHPERPGEGFVSSKFGRHFRGFGKR
jgi:hypothetical protein